jgi:hypothetical protein
MLLVELEATTIPKETKIKIVVEMIEDLKSRREEDLPTTKITAHPIIKAILLEEAISGHKTHLLGQLIIRWLIMQEVAVHQ